MSVPFDSVLLIGFGGPTAPGEIRPFLANVVRGRNIPPERLEDVAHHYEAIGGASPYNRHTFAQAEALRAELAGQGLMLPVYVGMRNWHPFLAETVARMNAEGRRRAVGVILAPHRCQASWERYQLDVARAKEVAGAGIPGAPPAGPEVAYLPPWHTHPLFIEAVAERIEAESGYRRGDWPADVPLLFTAHSIPLSMAQTCAYAAEIEQSSAAVAALLGARDGSVAYQSRSGDPRTPWLEPDVNDVLREQAAAGVREVVVVPVGFLCDHVEVLFDLDVEARETAAAAGLRLVRAPTVGDHPCFIRMLAGLVAATARQGGD